MGVAGVDQVKRHAGQADRVPPAPRRVRGTARAAQYHARNRCAPERSGVRFGGDAGVAPADRPPRARVAGRCPRRPGQARRRPRYRRPSRAATSRASATRHIALTQWDIWTDSGWSDPPWPGRSIAIVAWSLHLGSRDATDCAGGRNQEAYRGGLRSRPGNGSARHASRHGANARSRDAVRPRGRTVLAECLRDARSRQVQRSSRVGPQWAMVTFGPHSCASRRRVHRARMLPCQRRMTSGIETGIRRSTRSLRKAAR